MRARAITVVAALVIVIGGVAVVVRHRPAAVDVDSAARARPSSTTTASTSTTTTSSSSTTTTTVAPPTTAPDPDQARLATADAYARTRRGQVAISLIDTATGHQVDNRLGQLSYHSASLIKVVMALDKLERVEAAGRGLTEEEQEDLHQLIRYSNDDTGSKWWSQLGGPAVVTWVRQKTGLTHITPPASSSAWGATGITAHDWAILYRHLATDDGTFSHQARDTVLNEMRNVVAEQRWGIPTAIHASTAAVKPGWYDEGTAWRIHSTVIADFGGAANRYIAVCLTDGAPHALGMAYSEETCAGVGARLLPAGI